MDRSFAHLDSLSSSLWGIVQQCVREFEAAWAHEVPVLADYLPESEAARLAAFVELVHVDLELRCRRGLPLGIEQYLRLVPALADDDEVCLDLLVAEVALRQEREGALPLEDARARFPRLAERLQQRFEESQSAASHATRPGGPHSSHTLAAVRTPPVPNRIGKFEILECVGRGSFGTVYRARDTASQREVAVKIPLPSVLDNAEHRSRFFREARLAAQLQHPHIVALHEVGEDQGVCFIASEFVTGQTLRAKMPKQQAWTPDDAVAMMLQIGKALHYAHTKGIIHRDIKPENILVTAQSELKITDFGLARQEGADELWTEAGARMGTPAYMSPEQAGGHSHWADARTDLWALGVMLYELLTGHRPFEGSSVTILRAILQDEPRALRRHQQQIPKDLEAICLKCLAKNPDHRFPSAQHVVDELERWQRGLPVATRSINTVERTWRWAKRKPAAAALVLVSLVSMLMLALAGAWHNHQTRLANELLQSALAEAKEGRAKAEAIQGQMSLYEADRAVRERRLYEMDRYLGMLPVSQKSLDARRLQYEFLLRPMESALLTEHGQGVLAAQLSPDGKRLVSAGSDGQLLLWDASTGSVIRQLAPGYWDPAQLNWRHFYERPGNENSVANSNDCVTAVAWLPDGVRLVATELGGRVLLIDSETGERRDLWRAPHELYALALDTAGERALCGDAVGGLHLIGLDDASTQSRTVASSAILAAAWCDAARHWVVGSEHGQVRLLSGNKLESTAQEFEFPGPIWSLDARRDGAVDLIAIGSQMRGIPMLRSQSGSPDFEQLPALPLPAGGVAHDAVQCVRFLDARRVYAIDDQRRLALLDREAFEPIWLVEAVRPNSSVPDVPPDRHRPACSARPFERLGTSIMVSPTDQTLFTAGRDGTIRRWDTSESEGRRYLQLGGHPQLQFDPLHNDRLWAVADDGVLRVLDVEEGREQVAVAAHDAGPVALVAFGSGSEVVTAGRDGRIHFWKCTSDRITSCGASILHERPLLGVAASHHRRWVAAVDTTPQLIVWDLESARVVWRESLATGAPGPSHGALAFNCDDSRLFAFGPAGKATVCTTEPFQKLDTKCDVAGAGTALLWHPRDPHYVLLADDRKRVFETRFDKCQLAIESSLSLERETGHYVAVAATKDGLRWLLLARSGRLFFVDPNYPRVTLERPSRLGDACGLAVSRDSDQLAIAHEDGTVALWDTQAPHPRHPALLSNTCPREAWARQLLVPPSESSRSEGPSCTALDARGRVCQLYIEANSLLEKDGDGDLYYVEEGSGPPSRIAARVQHQPWGCGLMLDAQGRPLVALRQRYEQADQYKAQVCVARRSANSQWQQEVVVEQVNAGFFPVLRQVEQGLELFHFSYQNGHFLERATQHGQSWRNERIGRAGDGFQMLPVSSGPGALHLFFSKLPLGPLVHLRADGPSLERSPFEGTISSAPAVCPLPDGTLAVAVLLRGPSRAAQLGRWQAGNWSWQPLPSGAVPLPGGLAADAAGRLSFVSWDLKTACLYQWRQDAGDWSPVRIDHPLPREPRWICYRYDPQGREVLVVPIREGASERLEVWRP